MPDLESSILACPQCASPRTERLPLDEHPASPSYVCLACAFVWRPFKPPHLDSRRAHGGGVGTTVIRVVQVLSGYECGWRVGWEDQAPPEDWTPADAELFACVLARCAVSGSVGHVPPSGWTCRFEQVADGYLVSVSSPAGTLLTARTTDPLPLASVVRAIGPHFAFDLIQPNRCSSISIRPAR